MRSRRRLIEAVLMVSLLFPLSGCAGLISTPTSTPQRVADAQDTPLATRALAIEPTPTPVPTVSEEWSDGHIWISLDRVEETKTLSSDLNMPAASAGHTYVSVQLTVTRIEGVHLTDILGHGEDQAILLDGTGQAHDIVFGQFHGVEFADPSDITSPYEYVEGASGILVFEIPTDRKPASLTLIYSFKMAMEEEPARRGEITILLSG